MDEQDKKTALRMIPYGLYVMTAVGKGAAPAAATINWVTQTSFAPPLLALGVRPDSGVYGAATETGHFVLNILGKGQQAAAFTFFKPAQLEDGKLSGEEIGWAANGAPIIKSAAASIECRVAQVVELGDHHTIVAEVTAVHLHKQPEGRPDEAVLEMKDLGEKVFYGG
ncbi:MAG: flavin reductase family protein [Sphingomonadales bacterium]|jgi:flavin reductase (DIM6/NTAB) family NADH-FMN oxidoreductase RutF|nr:flavin reductase family protein [Sphingomonadales bacterium]